MELSTAQQNVCRHVRYQKRNIRSVRLGEAAVKYQTGTLKTGKGKIIPGELTTFAPPGSGFAYDTIFEVTKLRYVQLKQREAVSEIMASKYGFHISTGSVSHLSWQGLAYLEQCHFLKHIELRKYYRKTCFFIHLDGTCEGNSYNHFTVRDGMTGNILYADKIKSEHHRTIGIILQNVKELFGVPDAVISDMSPAISKAVKEVFPHTPHKICHFHFLKNIGIKLMLEIHDRMKRSVKSFRRDLTKMRNDMLKKSGIKTTEESDNKINEYEWFISIIDRINDFERDLNAEGFPFDLSCQAFYERCTEINNLLTVIIQTPENKNMKIMQEINYLNNQIQRHIEYTNPDIKQLTKMNDIFSELKNILKSNEKHTDIPLNWGLLEDSVDVEDMDSKLSDLQDKAERKTKYKSISKYEFHAWKTVFKQLKKYRKALIPKISKDGKTIILPKTNNLCEIGFRKTKRKLRLMTGNSKLSKQLNDLPSQFFYIENLEDPEYVKTVFGNEETFEMFSEVNSDNVRNTMNEMKRQRMSSIGINHKLIRDDDYLEKLESYFTSDHVGTDHSITEAA